MSYLEMVSTPHSRSDDSLHLQEDDGCSCVASSSSSCLGSSVLPHPTLANAAMSTSFQTIYLPVPGLVPTDQLTPGDLVGTNKDSYLILERLPAEYDNRVKAMEVDEKPTEEYSDIGGEMDAGADARVTIPPGVSCSSP